MKSHVNLVVTKHIFSNIIKRYFSALHCEFFRGHSVVLYTGLLKRLWNDKLASILYSPLKIFSFNFDFGICSGTSTGSVMSLRFGEFNLRKLM